MQSSSATNAQYKRSNSLLVPTAKTSAKKNEPHFNYSNQKKKAPKTKFGDTSSESSEDVTPTSRGMPATNSTTAGMGFGSRAKQ